MVVVTKISDEPNKAAKIKNEYLRTYGKKKAKSDKRKESSENGNGGAVEGSNPQNNLSELRKAEGDALMEDAAQNDTELTKKDVSKLIRGQTRRNELGRTCAEDRIKELMTKRELKEKVPISQRPWFTSIIGASVVANAIQLGIEVDYPQYKATYTVLEHLFTIVFTLEMLTKFVELRLAYFKDGWNLADFVLVWLSILDCWILTFVIDAGEGPDLRIFSMLRILRILRLLRAVRLFKVFHELWKIVKGILDSLRAVGWAAILLIFQLYICGVFCCVMVGKNTTAGYLRFEDQIDHLDELGRDFDVYQFYGTVPRAMYTLFETCIEPLNIRPVIERQPWMMGFFLAFIFISTFGLLNVIIGVIVEHTLAVSNEKKNAEMVRVFQEKMDKMEYVRENCFIDQDEDGNVSVEEIKEAFEKPDVVETLEEVDMPLGLQPQEFFDLLDANGNGEVTHDEMLMQLTRATVHTEHQLLLDLKIGLHSTQRQIRSITTGLAELKDQVKYGFCQILPEERMQSWPTEQCVTSKPNPDQALQNPESCTIVLESPSEHPVCHAAVSEGLQEFKIYASNQETLPEHDAKISSDEKCLDKSKIQSKPQPEKKFRFRDRLETPEIIPEISCQAWDHDFPKASMEKGALSVGDDCEKGIQSADDVSEELIPVEGGEPYPPAVPCSHAVTSSMELPAPPPGQLPMSPACSAPNEPPPSLLYSDDDAPPVPPDIEAPLKQDGPGLHQPCDYPDNHYPSPGAAFESQVSSAPTFKTQADTKCAPQEMKRSTDGKSKSS
eukprot:gnl/MRDRNA2_/MRDRNA2_34347_c0_seq1.p1 gnl/MRDRNA2_/MRDRNA2_34347_c0~~gnl/MRDRNA2_/MRDRNA2_34347_c0_seq1.p1  ORF type:complete len:781 (-),score=174.89 gnl/MRDRNA2_/MRDRNA2_34347_c0_seq1:326-2668(-)